MEQTDAHARGPVRQKRTRAKNKGQLSPLPMAWRPAMLPRLGSLIDWCSRALGRGLGHRYIAAVASSLLWLPTRLLGWIPGAGRERRLVPGMLLHRAAAMFYAVFPGNLLWPTMVPCKVQATIHVVRDERRGRPLDCWIWVRDGWRILWQNGAFGKGILSRSDPTWALRYKRDEQQQEQRRGGELYIEDLTQQRRAVRRKPATDARPPTMAPGVSEEVVAQMEPIQLSPFEALFLSELGCLDVSEPGSGIPARYPHAELYAVLAACHPQDDFALKYAAYYYYRAKGWVVRSGIKFGTDFLLYGRGGPARSHSQYSVVVRRLSGDADDGEELPHEQPHLSRSWQYMAALSRVCTQTRKSLIMCSVRPPPPPGEMPDAAGDTGLSLPPDLSQYEIQEVLVERFDANAK